MSNLRQVAQQALEALVTAYQGKDKTGQVTEAITALRAALAEPEPVIDKTMAVRIATQLGWEPPRKPLTEQEIQTIWAKTFEMGSSANTFARAIERAHGIKEQK